ncbi:serine/threonine-protein phosphatase 6 regulatory ankyrin repeat subunit A-like isoform X1 [Triticum dicoccoides]|uniref:serine/threonine-protein phosphatase 6 regulatory ankyrin repeat subunit A-like isoform X1 n=1 Tax=Triticum dicoccoides TaxID=85692 RepID=UPI00188EA623|nr:serine/threonine-protein phosphatase 6 regulatory ankyrin repeat subunit A-like isoform X1 [Triticum dicoccoides]
MASPLEYAVAVLQARLLQAAEDGDLPLFKRTARSLDGGKGRLREAVEGATASNCGARALHVAAVHGRMPVCAYLVEDLQVNVDATDESGETALSYAAVNGTVNVVRYLLDHGANPDKSGPGNRTPLHMAVAKGNCEIVKVLLSKGADVNCYSDSGTPLHIAAVFGLDGAMKILLDHHADCNKSVCIADTPLIVALLAHRRKCVKLLIKAGADLNGLGSADPVIVAIDEGLTDCLKCLLNAGADPNVLDDFGRLPIEVAASQNSREDVEILFPVSSRIPSVLDWSIDGIMAYVKSKEKDDPILKMNPANMKIEGNKAYKRKDYITAARLYTMAEGDYPENVTLISNRSVCWLKMGEGDKALRDAQICRALRRDWPKACFREGAARMLLKDYEKACDAFLDGLKLDPGNTEIENALREAFHSLEISHSVKKGH